jgi:inorganic pyrophosphatase
VNDYPQMFTHTLREIEHFFSVYKSLEGKKTEIAGWDSVETARKIILQGQQRLKQ